MHCDRYYVISKFFLDVGAYTSKSDDTGDKFSDAYQYCNSTTGKYSETCFRMLNPSCKNNIVENLRE